MSRCCAGRPGWTWKPGAPVGISTTPRSPSQTQATFGYTQNEVVRALTSGAPVFAAIVEELFPAAAVSDLKAFFGAADDADLGDRLSRMVASTSAFGASENIDTVPTSRFVLRSPFA